MSFWRFIKINFMVFAAYMVYGMGYYMLTGQQEHIVGWTLHAVMFWGFMPFYTFRTLKNKIFGSKVKKLSINSSMSPEMIVQNWIDAGIE